MREVSGKHPSAWKQNTYYIKLNKSFIQKCDYVMDQRFQHFGSTRIHSNEKNQPVKYLKDYFHRTIRYKTTVTAINNYCNLKVTPARA